MFLENGAFMKNNGKKSLMIFHSTIQIVFCIVLFFLMPSIVFANSPVPSFEESLTILSSKINHSEGKGEGCGYVSCIGNV